MNTKNGLKETTTLQQAEFQKGIFGLLGFMFLCQGLVSQGMGFWATMAIGVSLIVHSVRQHHSS